MNEISFDGDLVGRAFEDVHEFLSTLITVPVDREFGNSLLRQRRFLLSMTPALNIVLERGLELSESGLYSRRRLNFAVVHIMAMSV